MSSLPDRFLDKKKRREKKENLDSSVEEEAVGGTVEVAGDLVGGGGADELVKDSLGSGQGVEGEVQSSNTSNVRRGHRGTGDGVGGSVGTDPGRGDTDTGGEDLNTASPRGEVSGGIVLVRGSDGEGVGGTGGRSIASIHGLVVTSSDDQWDTLVEEALSSGINGGRLATTQGHVDDRLAGNSVGGNPVHTRDDTGGGARSGGAQDLDTDQLDLLGNTVLGTTDGTGNVGAVSVLVNVGGARDEVGASGGTATKVSVGGVDTSVNNVGGDSLTSGIVVEVVGVDVQVALGDARKTPRWRGGLRSREGDDGILLDVLDLIGSQDLLEGSLVEGTSETLERVELAVDGGLATTAVLAAGNVIELGLEVGGGLTLLEDDDVRVSDGLASVVDQGSSLGNGNDCSEDDSELHGEDESERERWLIGGKVWRSSCLCLGDLTLRGKL